MLRINFYIVEKLNNVGFILKKMSVVENLNRSYI